MRGQQDTTNFIKSFTGSHHFVLDYLVEEVLHNSRKRSGFLTAHLYLGPPVRPIV